jgi:hypothetical protein
VSLGLHVADDRLDGGSTPQFALDDAEHAAVCTDNLNAGVAVMKSAQDGA